MFFLLFLAILFLNSPAVFAQESLLPPPIQGNFPTLKASTGAPFVPGWNFFNVGFDNCTTLNVLNELQADGGSALEVNAIFVKEFVGWQSFTFQSPKQKKVSANETIAFNSNQKFFLQIDEKACTSTDSNRQAQIEKVRESQTAKNDFLGKVSELPVDLWTKLTNIINREGPATPEQTPNPTLDNLIIGGKTTVNDLGITGTITAGLLTINGFNNVFASLNTLSDDLYIQNEELGGINILNGKVLVDKNGNLKITNSLTAKKINIDESDTSSKTVGSIIIKAGETQAQTTTTGLSSKSYIFVTPDFPVAVAAKKDKTTIIITIKEPLSQDLRVNWWIVN